MNIFELLSNDRSGFFLQSITQQTPWSRIKTIIDNLFQYKIINLQETQKLWNQIKEGPGEIVKLTFDYYLNALNTQLHSTHLNRLKSIVNDYPQEKIERISSYINTQFQLHYSFISVINSKYKQSKSELVNQFSSQIKILLLNQLNIQKLLDQYFRLLHYKHSKSVLDNSLVQYDQQTSDYIRELISNLKDNINTMEIKKVMKLVSDLSLQNQCLNSINSYITSDMKSFVNKFQESIQQNSPFLIRCQMYYDSFHNSFLKMFAEYFLEQVHISRKRINEIKFHKNYEVSRNKIYLMYGQLLAKNVFTITLMYPDSERLVKQLKKCIDKVGLIERVCTFLTNGIQNRLLTPGVVTQNILLQYINMLKVLQIIDSTGQIYDQITIPIKSYLLKRNDTLRCIINHLMSDDKQNPIDRLGTQLVKLPSKQFCDIESEEDQNWNNNLPLERKLSITKYQQIDLITVLVNLYGSQQSFISEYQIMLAQKLMGAKDYNIDEEVINLQRLKQRFGEQALQACNIIVKDFKDSKRIDNIINKQAKILNQQILQQKDLHTIIVSKGYWPINYQDNPFNLPKFFKNSFDNYGQKFSRIKAMRKIQFHYDLGYVNIVLTFENGDVPFRCLPVHAVIISFFDETKNKDKKVSVEYLMKQLDLSQSVVRQRLSFWIHKGVVKPCLSLQSKTSISLKRLNSYQQGSAQFYTTVDIYKKPLKSDDTLEDGDDIIFKQSSYEAKIKLAQDLIQKIVHFNGSKSSQQIFLLLKTVYKSQINFDFTEAQTKDILKKMVGKKRLLFNDEVYSYCGKRP